MHFFPFSSAISLFSFSSRVSIQSLLTSFYPAEPEEKDAVSSPTPETQSVENFNEIINPASLVPCDMDEESTEKKWDGGKDELRDQKKEEESAGPCKAAEPKREEKEDRPAADASKTAAAPPTIIVDNNSKPNAIPSEEAGSASKKIVENGNMSPAVKKRTAGRQRSKTGNPSPLLRSTSKKEESSAAKESPLPRERKKRKEGLSSKTDRKASLPADMHASKLMVSESKRTRSLSSEANPEGRPIRSNSVTELSYNRLDLELSATSLHPSTPPTRSTSPRFKRKKVVKVSPREIEDVAGGSVDDSGVAAVGNKKKKKVKKKDPTSTWGRKMKNSMSKRMEAREDWLGRELAKEADEVANMGSRVLRKNTAPAGVEGEDSAGVHVVDQREPLKKRAFKFWIWLENFKRNRTKKDPELIECRELYHRYFHLDSFASPSTKEDEETEKKVRAYFRPSLDEEGDEDESNGGAVMQALRERAKKISAIQEEILDRHAKIGQLHFIDFLQYVFAAFQQCIEDLKLQEKEVDMMAKAKDKKLSIDVKKKQLKSYSSLTIEEIFRTKMKEEKKVARQRELYIPPLLFSEFRRFACCDSQSQQPGSAGREPKTFKEWQKVEGWSGEDDDGVSISLLDVPGVTLPCYKSSCIIKEAPQKVHISYTPQQRKMAYYLSLSLSLSF